jgi:riboflavin biosynthesis pyrimidine reductase
MLRVLREEHDIRSVLCEGGPTLNSFLLAADAVDELFLCTSPQLAGGRDALPIVAANALAKPRAAELVWLLRGGGELFARWRITPS